MFLKKQVIVISTILLFLAHTNAQAMLTRALGFRTAVQERNIHLVRVKLTLGNGLNLRQSKHIANLYSSHII